MIPMVADGIVPGTPAVSALASGIESESDGATFAPKR